MERQYASLTTGLWYGSSWARVVELVYRLHQAPPRRRRHCRRHRRRMTSIVGCGRVSDEEACNVPEVFERICDITIECYTSRIITILNNVVSTPKKHSRRLHHVVAKYLRPIAYDLGPVRVCFRVRQRHLPKDEPIHEAF
jgi:hypothetical protein